MKKFYLALFASLPLMMVAQSTPATDEIEHSHPGITSVSNREFGDTIDFNEHTTGVVITDQYATTHGAIFSGAPDPYFCDIYDYVGSYGPVLKSSTWFDIVRIDFVNPEDISETLPICVFGFKNAAISDLDYIIAKFYNSDDNLILSYTSSTVDPVATINLPDGAAYVLMDDSLSTAYVIDDVWFETGDCFVSVPDQGKNEITVYPNPAESVITIDPAGTWIYNLSIIDMTGREVKNIVFNSSSATQIDIADIAPGLYMICSQDRKTISTIIIE